MYRIELIGKNTRMFVLTPRYEIYGPDKNTLQYIDLRNGITTFDIQEGDHISIFDEYGFKIVDYEVV